MLYNTEWSTKADPFELTTLISWLEMQNPEKSYDYVSNTECVLAQYFSAMGFQTPHVRPFTVEYKSDHKSLPSEFDWVANGCRGSYAHTFGAALYRAKSLAAY